MAVWDQSPNALGKIKLIDKTTWPPEAQNRPKCTWCSQRHMGQDEPLQLYPCRAIGSGKTIENTNSPNCTQIGR